MEIMESYYLYINDLFSLLKNNDFQFIYVMQPCWMCPRVKSGVMPGMLSLFRHND